MGSVLPPRRRTIHSDGQRGSRSVGGVDVGACGRRTAWCWQTCWCVRRHVRVCARVGRGMCCLPSSCPRWSFVADGARDTCSAEIDWPTDTASAVMHNSFRGRTMRCSRLCAAGRCRRYWQVSMEGIHERAGCGCWLHPLEGQPASRRAASKRGSRQRVSEARGVKGFETSPMSGKVPYCLPYQ